jgi:hypothetical protein
MRGAGPLAPLCFFCNRSCLAFAARNGKLRHRALFSWQALLRCHHPVNPGAYCCVARGQREADAVLAFQWAYQSSPSVITVPIFMRFIYTLKCFYRSNEKLCCGATGAQCATLLGFLRRRRCGCCS